MSNVKSCLMMFARYHHWANAKLIAAVHSAKLQQQQQYQLVQSSNAASSSTISTPAVAAATIELLERLPDGTFFGSIHNTVSHIAGVDDLWYLRVTVGDSSRYNYLYASETPPTAWGDLFSTFDEAAAVMELRSQRWIQFVEACNEDALSRPIIFADSSGNPTSRQLAAALFHIFNHGTHHRGQVHAALTSLEKGVYASHAPSLDMPLMGETLFRV